MTTTSSREKLIFTKYKFFFQITNSPQMYSALKEGIHKLGGTVEPFLDNHINYVVTNRQRNEWPEKKSQNSNISNVMQRNSLSRGQMLLAKSAQRMPITTDVLVKARELNVKIVHSSDILRLINKYNPEGDKIKDKESDVNNRQLSTPYLKVIDGGNRFRPLVKELVEWPEIHFEYQAELCPFYKPRKNAVSTYGGPSQQLQQSNKSNAIVAQEKRTNQDKFQTVLTTPVFTGATLNNTTTNTTAKLQGKRKHTTFCEICQCEYDDLKTHLQYEKHAAFLDNESNFTELVGVIDSLPTFLEKPPPPTPPLHHMAKNSQGSSDQDFNFAQMPNSSENSLDNNRTPAIDTGMVTRKMPSPMMRSIHLNTCESMGGNLVPLHDLINKADDKC